MFNGETTRVRVYCSVSADFPVTLALHQVSALSISLEEAAMVISIRKSMVMHVHKKTRVSATTEADVASLNLTHKCSACAREFTKQRGLSIHMARWCDGGRTQRSRLGTLTDKAVKTATLGKFQIEKNVLDNVYSFEYLGSRLQCDGDDEADVRYRMDIAKAAFASLSHLWMDHRLSRNMNLMLYNLCACSTLTHSCEAWNQSLPTCDYRRRVP